MDRASHHECRRAGTTIRLPRQFSGLRFNAEGKVDGLGFKAVALQQNRAMDANRLRIPPTAAVVIRFSAAAGTARQLRCCSEAGRKE